MCDNCVGAYGLGAYCLGSSCLGAHCLGAYCLGGYCLGAYVPRLYWRGACCFGPYCLGAFWLGPIVCAPTVIVSSVWGLIVWESSVGGSIFSGPLSGSLRFVRRRHGGLLCRGGRSRAYCSGAHTL